MQRRPERYLTTSLLLILFGLATPFAVTADQLADKVCTSGTRDQLLKFFQTEGLLLIADGVQTSSTSNRPDSPNVMFLVDQEGDYFYVFRLTRKGSAENYQACQFVSAREIDYRVALPIDNLIVAPKREHMLFLNQIPDHAKCPDTKKRCMPWSQWSHLLRNTQLLSGYIVSSRWDFDAYDEPVEIKLGDQLIQTTRGKLTEFARQKYAQHMRGQIDETEQEQAVALALYKKINMEADHHHPLLLLWLTDNGKWAVSAIDRVKGLVWTPIHGVDFRLYPEPKSYYQQHRLPSSAQHE